jgi:dipeptidyl aminopeptidase/acylaminoacyl peptidase
MKRLLIFVSVLLASAALAQVPSNLVVDGVPNIPPQLVEKVRPYLDARGATLNDWNPVKPEMLITTRLADTPQLHIVRMPGGARRQITFFDDRVGGGRYRRNDPNTIIFAKDVGGGEFFQLYRDDLQSGQITLLTDGKSRNTGGASSRDGKWIAYSSTRRNGKDTDLYVMDPMAPESSRMVLQVNGGGWSTTDFSPDNAQLLVHNEISANEAQLYLLETKTGQKKLITPKDTTAAYSRAVFSPDGASTYFTTDAGSEFHQLVRMKLADGSRQVLSHSKWDVDEFALSDGGNRLAFVTNENGISVLHVIDSATAAEIALPKLPLGVIGSLRWHPNGRLLGFSIVSARSPTDVYSIDLDNGKLERWTESETGGLNPERNVDPELVSMKSFDGTQITAFVYRPDPARFPGKRPALIIIHGGPEGQSLPLFLGRNNYWINEMGIALVYPNVRGSTGYGKTFLAMDDGYKREDAVRDIGTVISWIKADPRLDGDRIGVYGGSYGGYMTLASMTHYNDQLRAAIDVVGISNFLTFLKNTSAYRVDLRRVEYGDERDPKMQAFLQQISPQTSASKITRPLFVIAGFNDPRVPYTEGEQMVKSVRANGAPVWFLMAKDEGHGFARKRNQDFQFLAMTMFLDKNLLGNQ